MNEEQAVKTAAAVQLLGCLRATHPRVAMVSAFDMVESVPDQLQAVHEVDPGVVVCQMPDCVKEGAAGSLGKEKEKEKEVDERAAEEEMAVEERVEEVETRAEEVEAGPSRQLQPQRTTFKGRVRGSAMRHLVLPPSIERFLADYAAYQQGIRPTLKQAENTISKVSRQSKRPFHMHIERPGVNAGDSMAVVLCTGLRSNEIHGVIRAVHRTVRNLARPIVTHQLKVKAKKMANIVSRESLRRCQEQARVVIPELLSKSFSSRDRIDEHKTNRDFGGAQIFLTFQEFSWLERLLQVRKRLVSKSKRVFITRGGRPLKNLVRYMQTVWAHMGLLGRPTFTDPRTAVSGHVKNIHNETNRDQLARFMCHSTSTADRFYSLVLDRSQAMELRGHFDEYAIRDEAVSRQDIYISCLETCSEAAAHIAVLTRQKRQGEERNRFLQKEIGLKNDHITDEEMLEDD
ncbi:hypothetical protein EYF80_056599 [Liparis tanakae]|uniref:Uncharacterized protein n=1 Tax=Liparis tanakae TaxID=230148 RepID=A0A4Z2EX98_9TELE|nr:hypothetical protein EYF80_056599 [Liparis tanakae]